MTDPTRALAAAVAALFAPDRPVHPWPCLTHAGEEGGCPRDTPAWRKLHAMFEVIAARQAELRGESLRPTPPFAEWIRDKLTECRPGTEKEIAERRAAHEAAKPQVEALAAMVEDARARVAARTETTEGSG